MHLLCRYIFVYFYYTFMFYLFRLFLYDSEDFIINNPYTIGLSIVRVSWCYLN